MSFDYQLSWTNEVRFFFSQIADEIINSVFILDVFRLAPNLHNDHAISQFTWHVARSVP